MLSLLSRYQEEIDRIARKFDYINLYDELCEAIENNKADVIQSDKMGLVVVKPVFKDGEVGLLIWLALGKAKNAIARYIDFFEKGARQCGFKYIEFRTKRKGFERLAKKFDFKQDRPCDGFFVYRKEV